MTQRIQVVQLDPLAGIVPPHDALDGPQQALKAVLAQSGDLDLGGADDAGGAGRVVQQGQLAEIVALLVGAEGLGGAAVALVHLGLAALEDEEGLARVALADDGRAGGELLRVERVGDLGPFVRLQRREQRHFFQEGFVHAAPLEGRVHEDAAEGHAVEGPEGGGFGGDDGGGSGGVVHECEFAEGAAWADGGDFVAHAVGTGLDGAGFVDVDVESAFLDDVKVVAGIALGDDFDILGRNHFFDERAKDLVGLFFVEMGEEEVARYSAL